jgi:hypothetical protein
MRVKIISEAIGEVLAEIREDKNPKTAKAVLAALPLESEARRWGDEVYFGVPLESGAENTQEEVEVGDLAYWPQGPALCIFFGPTPASEGNQPRAASGVNVFGKILGDPTVFRKVQEGDRLKVGKAE